MEYQPKIYGLILAGGSGTRLWPLSRKELPKQFLSLGGEYTLLQSTLLRLKGKILTDNIRVIAGNEWGALINHQAGEVGFFSDIVIKEPVAINTAPAIALGIASLIDEGASNDDVVLVCPSDHVISDTKSFHGAITKAIKETEAGRIVTFGIRPLKPETGFGYIKTENIKSGISLKVLQFVEKPDLKTAKSFLREGNYYWNSGIFCFRIGDMFNALVKYFPECGIPARDGLDCLIQEFPHIPAISIDYAVMERAENIVCIPLDAKWSDLGSWDSVWDNLIKDENSNAVIGDVILNDTQNTLIVSPEKLTVAVDVQDIIVVDSPDALFITKKGREQKVREVVKQLKTMKRKEAEQASSSARPWGTYKILSEDEKYKVKRIIVSPKKRLSLQYHDQRSEHWIVVKGRAKITLFSSINMDNKEELFLNEGQSCFVPQGMLHRLENPGEIPLEIIEVQIGDYVGEDDIVRIADDFNRE